MQKFTVRLILSCLLCLAGTVSNFAQTSGPCTPQITVTVIQNSTCENNGVLRIQVAENSNFDMEQLEYGVNSPDGDTRSPAPGDGFIRNLSPGNYTAYVRLFCFTEGEWISVQANYSVLITSTFIEANMAIATPNIRLSLNCVPSGMVPIEYIYGTPPYTATMTAWPAGYNGEKSFSRLSAGSIQVSPLPAGTYTFVLGEGCGKTVTVSATVPTVTSDVPTTAMTMNTYHPVRAAEACKGIDVGLNYLATTHELYPYISNTALLNEYYEMVLTETATGKQSVAPSITAGSLVYSGSGVRGTVQLIDYNYEDMYPEPTTAALGLGVYPAGRASTPGSVTVALRVKGCVTTAPPTNVTLNRPTITLGASSVTSCTHGTIVSTGPYYYNSPYRHSLMCSPITARLFNATNDTIAVNTIQVPTSATSTLSSSFTNIPFGGTYWVEWEGGDGAKWRTANLSYNRTNTFSQSQYSLPYCPEDGKRSYFYISVGNTATNAFFPGATIEVIQAPEGQHIPPIITINTLTTSSQYPYGSGYSNLAAGTYIVRVTNGCGASPVDITVTIPAGNAQYMPWSSLSDYNYSTARRHPSCKNYLNKTYAFIWMRQSSSSSNPSQTGATISGNTRIVFVDGPNGANDPMVIHKDVTIPSGYTPFFNPFHRDYAANNVASWWTDVAGYLETETPLNPTGITPGNYTFSITDGACGNTVTVTLNVPTPFYVDPPLSYTTEFIPCAEGGNIRLYPNGRVNRVGATVNTRYIIMSAHDEWGQVLPTSQYDTRTILPEDAFTLWRNGRYVIRMFESNNNLSTAVCSFSDTVTFNYRQPMASVDPMHSSAYVCVGHTIGRLRLQGTGGYGNGPYWYEIPDTDPLLENSTGDFIYGRRAEDVLVRITDISPEAEALGCRLTIDQTVHMLDLQTARIAYDPHGLEKCAGDNINLYCVTLGQTYYKWTGPNNFVSNDQFTIIPNSTVNMTGWYVVEVWPEFCGEIVKDSMFIHVRPLPQTPVLTNNDLKPCYNSGSVVLSTATGITVPSGFSPRWYNEDGTLIAAGSITTTPYFTRNYYVTLVNDTTSCESARTPFRVEIIAPPAPLVVNFPAPVCYGEIGVITIPNTNPNFTYRMYTTNATANIAAEQQGNGGTLTFRTGTTNTIPMPVEGAPITANTNRYFTHTDNTTGCTNTSRTLATINLATSGTTADIQVPEIIICSGDSANITVSSTVANPVFRWYTTNTTAAVLLHTGETYSPVLHNYSNANTTHTVFVTVEGNDICENLPTAKASVTVTVRPMPLIYVSSNTGGGAVSGDGIQHIVGTGTTTVHYMPVATYYRNSYVQQIYTPEDFEGLAPSSLITNIAYQYIHTVAQTKDPVTIYMGNTTKSAFASATDWVPVSEMQQVFNGSITFPVSNNTTPTWVDIPLDNIFRYSGGNIVVAVLNNTNNYTTSSNVTFRTHTAVGNKSLRHQTDGAVLNVNAPPSGTAGTPRNNTRFTAQFSRVTLCVGKTDTLASTVPDGTWSSSNPAIAVVNSNSGIITGVSEGKVVISFTPYSNVYCVTVSDTITVTPLPDVSITGNSSICSNSTTQLSPTTGGTWVSNNPSVATVTDAGVVTAVSAGTATFTFTNEGGCYATTSAVTVTTLPTAQFSYSESYYCTAISTPQNPTLTGTNAYTGGTYSATPIGLNINPSTGAINPSTSDINTYTVTYTIPALGGCAAIPVTTTVEIRNCTNLTLTKTASTPTVCSGSDITFTIMLVNNAQTAANGITLVDEWPSNFTYKSHTASVGSSYDNATKTWTMTSLAAGATGTLTIVGTANTPGENIVNKVFVSAVNGLTYTSSTSTITDQVSVTIHSLATSSTIEVTINGGNAVCTEQQASLAASVTGITGPIFKWYETATSTPELFTGNPFVSSTLQTDTVFYVSVSGNGYCESSTRLQVNIPVNCTHIRGTMFPFVHMNSGDDPEGDRAFNALFPVTASLYEIPPAGLEDPIEAIDNSTPIQSVRAVYYDGSIHIPGTPKYPGMLGRRNQPGVPINWGRIQQEQDPATNHTPVTGVRDVPIGDPVGMFTFENVTIGREYVLYLHRPGYLTRYAKITVEPNGVLGHRFLIPGDLNGDSRISSQDVSLLSGNFSAYGRPAYNPAFDLDANARVESHDNSLLNYYLNCTLNIYTDTFDFVRWYYSLPSE